MPLIKRTELQDYLKRGGELADTRAFLFFGERYLCRESVEILQEALLKEQPGAVHPIDGDREDPGQTMARLMSYSLLPGRQIYRVTDSRIFHSKTVASDIWEKAISANDSGKTGAARRHIQALATIASLALDSTSPFTEIAGGQWQKLFGFAKPDGDLGWADALWVEAVGTGKVSSKSAVNTADKMIETLGGNLPPANFLLLTAETVDKRQKLFTFIKKNGLVIDCTVATGAGAAAQKEQKEVLREVMLKTLAEFGKKIEPQAIELFFDRVGFHPVAVVTETEKLAHFVGEGETITCSDLETMVARSREDALFELTDAFGKRQVGRTLVILGRLIDNGTHGLAILATMRNYIRKQLIFRSIQLQSSPTWQNGMTAQQFQNSYLPALKQSENWTEHLGGHPYALFMSFSKASGFSCNQLKNWLTLLLEAEYRLKGSPLPQHLVLEELFLSMFRQRKAG